MKKPKILGVNFNRFDFTSQGGKFTATDKVRLTTEINRANRLIRKEYEYNPDNPVFDLINHELFLLTDHEKIGVPTINIPRKKSQDVAEKYLELVDYVLTSEELRPQTRNKGFNTTINKINEMNRASGQHDLSQREINVLKNVYRSTDWSKLKELLGSDRPFDIVNQLVMERAEDGAQLNSFQIGKILNDFIRTGGDAASFVAYADEQMEKFKHGGLSR